MQAPFLAYPKYDGAFMVDVNGVSVGQTSLA